MLKLYVSNIMRDLKDDASAGDFCKAYRSTYQAQLDYMKACNLEMRAALDDPFGVDALTDKDAATLDHYQRLENAVFGSENESPDSDYDRTFDNYDISDEAIGEKFKRDMDAMLERCKAAGVVVG
jgi:hypothetical protein